MAPWADLLYACDIAWWEKYIGEVCEKFTGEAWAYEPQAARYGIKIINGNPSGIGLGKNNLIHTGGNSGYQAINLVYLMGAKKIILLGFDMQRTKGQSHWHGDHPKELNRHSDFGNWRGRFVSLARDLKKEGVEVINATRESALDCFERKTVEEVLC